MTEPKQKFHILYPLQLPHEVAKLKEFCDATLSCYPTQSYPLEALSEHYIKTGKCIIPGVLEDKLNKWETKQQIYISAVKI